jgi:hypothetical protein
MVAGGLITSVLGLPPPPLPDGMDAARSSQYLMLLSPLFALALALLARGLAGGLLPRTLILAFVAWVAYSLNNAIEGTVVTSLPVPSAAFAAVVFMPACLLCGLAVAWLFPAATPGASWRETARRYFARCKALSWAWRLALAAVCFAPVYWFFGVLVTPFTLDYYRQNLYGLRMPSVEVLVPVLLVRSTLFMLACLPIIAGWLLTGKSLFWRLGFALFVLVGFIYMLAATYMPLSVRVPHTLEILADSLVHAGLLVLLLWPRGMGEARQVDAAVPATPATS